MDHNAHALVFSLGGRANTRGRRTARRVDIAEGIILRLLAHGDGYGHTDGNKLLALDVDFAGAGMA